MPTSSRENGTEQTAAPQEVGQRAFQAQSDQLETDDVLKNLISKHSLTLSLASALIGLAATLLYRRIRSSTDPSLEVDLSKIDNDAANKFEQWHKITVERGARDALLKPALPHTLSVVRAIKRGEISLEFLESSVLSILENARAIELARRQENITGAAVRMAMKRYCPYMFWC